MLKFKILQSKRAQLKGATTVEYGILVGMLALATIGAIFLFGKSQAETFEDIASAMEGAGLEEGVFINGGYWFDGQLNMPTEDCWNGTDGDDTIEHPQNLIYQCFNGSSGNDIVYGNVQNNYFGDGLGDDIFYGGDGNDRMDGWKGDDTYYAGRGDDNITDNHGYNTVYAGSGNDYIHGEGDFFGEDGDDEISLTFWTSRADGGPGDDTFTVNSSKWTPHYITGGSGLDTVNLTDPSVQFVSIHEFSDFENGYDTINLDAISVSDLQSLPTDVSLGIKDGSVIVRFEGLGTFVTLTGIDPAPFNLQQTPGVLFGTENAEYVTNNNGPTFYDTDGETYMDPSVTEIRLLGGDDFGLAYASVPMFGGLGNDTIQVGINGFGYGEDGSDLINITAVNNNVAYGNGGNDNDILNINGGNRTSITVEGGPGADIFNKINVTQNALYSARDTIVDFEPNFDTFQIDGVSFNFKNPPAGFTVTDDGSGNALVSYNSDDRVTFEGVTVAQLAVPQD